MCTRCFSSVHSCVIIIIVPRQWWVRITRRGEVGDSYAATIALDPVRRRVRVRVPLRRTTTRFACALYARTSSVVCVPMRARVKKHHYERFTFASRRTIYKCVCAGNGRDGKIHTPTSFDRINGNSVCLKNGPADTRRGKRTCCGEPAEDDRKPTWSPGYVIIGPTRQVVRANITIIKKLGNSRCCRPQLDNRLCARTRAMSYDETAYDETTFRRRTENDGHHERPVSVVRPAPDRQTENARLRHSYSRVGLYAETRTRCVGVSRFVDTGPNRMPTVRSRPRAVRVVLSAASNGTRRMKRRGRPGTRVGGIVEKRERKKNATTATTITLRFQGGSRFLKQRS